MCFICSKKASSVRPVLYKINVVSIFFKYFHENIRGYCQRKLWNFLKHFKQIFRKVSKNRCFSWNYWDTGSNSDITNHQTPNLCWDNDNVSCYNLSFLRTVIHVGNPFSNKQSKLYLYFDFSLGYSMFGSSVFNTVTTCWLGLYLRSTFFGFFFDIFAFFLTNPL